MNYNLPNHISGDTFNGVDFQVLVNGLPQDLTGFTIRMEVKPGKIANASLTLTSTNNQGIEITNAAEGRFRIMEQKIDLNPQRYFYDIQFTQGDYVKTWIMGQWVINSDITL